MINNHPGHHSMAIVVVIFVVVVVVVVVVVIIIIISVIVLFVLPSSSISSSSSAPSGIRNTCTICLSPKQARHSAVVASQRLRPCYTKRVLVVKKGVSSEPCATQLIISHHPTILSSMSSQGHLFTRHSEHRNWQCGSCRSENARASKALLRDQSQACFS